MNPPPPLKPETLREIEALHREIDAVLSRHPRGGRRLEQFEARRHALLAAHLGRTPARPVETLHCLGDSHTMFFAGAKRIRFIHFQRTGLFHPRWINRGLDLLPCFRTYHLGPATAYRAADPASATRTRAKIDLLIRRHLPPRARLLLSFGEIDCRIHIARRVRDGADLTATCRRTVDAFLRLPLELRDLGFRPAVWGPPIIIPLDENLTDEDFPIVGSWDHRRDVTLAYRDRLLERCAAEGIPAVCLAGEYHPHDQRPTLDLAPDGVHLTQGLMPTALRKLSEAGVLELD